MAAVPTDPWSAGFMALGSIAKPEPVSSGAQNSANISFDNSGFVVNVGPGSATSTKTALPSAGQALQAAAAGVGGLLGNPVLIIAIGLGLFLYLKHK
jgi:hypothetical protein